MATASFLAPKSEENKGVEADCEDDGDNDPEVVGP